MTEQVFYTLHVSANETKIIGAALSELPYKVAIGVMQNLQSQISAQDEARNEIAEKEQEKAKK